MLPNHGKAKSSAEEVRAPPGYRILRGIGQGGMGEVYLAVQADLDRKVAIKYLRHDATGAPDSQATRFSRESSLHWHLEHPNIVAVYDCGSVDDGEYFVMELGELAEAIRWCEKAVECAPLYEKKSLQKQLDGYQKRQAALPKP